MSDSKSQSDDVITLQDKDHHSIEMYFETPDGESKAMEITYTRGE